MRERVRRIRETLRDAWVIVGLTLVLFLFLELLYRTQAVTRRALRGELAAAPAHAVNHPRADEPLHRDLVLGRHRSVGGGVRYDPFRGWWPLREVSRHVNVDADGRRVTVQPPTAPGPRRLVYMFGGSVMWGYVVRDSFTIPSLVATRLRILGYSDVEVVNLSQSMFDLAQNLSTLLVELRHGRVPAIAVFLDGINEVATVYQSGEVGHILNEQLIARRFSREKGLGHDLGSVLRHSALVRRLTERERGATGSAAMCDAVAASYSRQVRVIELIATGFMFDPIFLWQPLLATSKKPLSEAERGIKTGPWRPMMRRCAAAADSLLADRRGTTFFPLQDFFDSDSATVFVDDFGHLTERANAIIADYIAIRVAERLGPPHAKPVK